MLPGIFLISEGPVDKKLYGLALTNQFLSYSFFPTASLWLRWPYSMLYWPAYTYNSTNSSINGKGGNLNVYPTVCVIVVMIVVKVDCVLFSFVNKPTAIYAWKHIFRKPSLVNCLPLQYI